MRSSRTMARNCDGDRPAPYPDAHRLTVAVGFSGCRFATNGRLAGVATHALLRQLRRLTA